MKYIMLVLVMMLVLVGTVSAQNTCVDQNGKEHYPSTRHIAVYPTYMGFDYCRSDGNMYCQWSSPVEYVTFDSIDYHVYVTGLSAYSMSADYVEGFSAVARSDESYEIGMPSMYFTNDRENDEKVFTIVYGDDEKHMTLSGALDGDWHKIRMMRDEIDTQLMNLYIDDDYVGTIDYSSWDINSGRHDEGVLNIARQKFIANGSALYVDDVVYVNRERLYRYKWQGKMIWESTAYMKRKPTSKDIVESWYFQYVCGDDLLRRDFFRSLKTGVSVVVEDKGTLEEEDVIVVEGSTLNIQKNDRLSVWWRFLSWLKK